MKNITRFLLFTLALSVAVNALADTITMRDGRRYDGVVFLSGSSRSGVIMIRDRRGTIRRLSIQDVASLEFGNGNYSNYAPPQGEAPPPGYGYRRQENQNQPNDTSQQEYQNQNYSTEAQGERRGRRYAQAATIVIPSGTQIDVRTDEQIDSRNAHENRTFYGTVSQDVVDNQGNVAIPRGSQAELVIRHGRQGTASEYLLLDMDAVTVNGVRYWATASDVPAKSREGLGTNRRTAEMVGGGALVGSLIGAIAGGGKGAAIGAAAGAAAGAGAEVITKGNKVRVPAESILSFRLNRGLVLQPPQG